MTHVGLHLMDLGADVNAIAKSDVMPLNLTQLTKKKVLASRGEEDEEPLTLPLEEALLKRGARDTWRRSVQPIKKSSNDTRVFASFSGGGSGGQLSSEDVVMTRSVDGGFNFSTG
eukprot:CAMPEP_0185764776 /NCGR_PEP_ID=MMETSP1174-20130828/23740_1 /TAXON_ID=35687 /ORGANISM="Dictyocha speculum, Strain CCMP1381" /LENGTH=114 /DNA_ID=CAMNT_0028447463 /DNA_START=15 /DNA_END=359 /DNA_ORIENTATION=+